MRIIENYHDYLELYTDELKKSVVDTFQYAKRLAELQNLLNEIKKETVKLQEFFLTKKELEERKNLLNFFDSRMQSMVLYTKINMDKYRLFGWKELIDYGDHENDGNK